MTAAFELREKGTFMSRYHFIAKTVLLFKFMNIIL